MSDIQNIVQKITEMLKDNVQLKIVNKEFAHDVDDDINEVTYRERTWFNDAWQIVVVSKGDSYHWDAWGHTDLEYLLNQTIVLLQKAKDSESEFYNHLKTFLKVEEAV